MGQAGKKAIAIADQSVQSQIQQLGLDQLKLDFGLLSCRKGIGLSLTLTNKGLN